MIKFAILTPKKGDNRYLGALVHAMQFSCVYLYIFLGLAVLSMIQTVGWFSHLACCVYCFVGFH